MDGGDGSTIMRVSSMSSAKKKKKDVRENNYITPVRFSAFLGVRVNYYFNLM